MYDPYRFFSAAVPHPGQTAMIPDAMRKVMAEHLSLMREINRKLDRIEQHLQRVEKGTDS